MVNGDSLPDDELVIRRFDPTNPHNFTADDAGLPARLRQSALRFDIEDGVIGCSVYQDSKLSTAGLQRLDCIEATNSNWELAAASVLTIKSVTRKTVPTENPFDVIEDAFPNGAPPTHLRDSAHALITHPATVRGTDKWYQVLAYEFTVNAAVA